MTNLNIVGLNLDIAWKDKAANFRTIEKEFHKVQADIFMLPEMFSTGFYMNADEIADKENETLNWMRDFAQKRNTAVCGSVSISENEKFFNRFYFVMPDGAVRHYDKKHLFSFSGEDKTYSAGTSRTIVEYKGWRILLQICYDLRFPVFSRNNGDYDAVFYVANWPETRIDAWQTLLKARAIENQAYVFGLNRIGQDGNKLCYPESSYCFFADGSLVSSKKNNLVEAKLNAEILQTFREKFQFLNDRDSFKIC